MGVAGLTNADMVEALNSGSWQGSQYTFTMQVPATLENPTGGSITFKGDIWKGTLQVVGTTGNVPNLATIVSAMQQEFKALSQKYNDGFAVKTAFDFMANARDVARRYEQLEEQNKR